MKESDVRGKASDERERGLPGPPAVPRGISAGSALRRGRPPGERLRREIPFSELPAGCRCLVLDVYGEIWGL